VHRKADLDSFLIQRVCNDRVFLNVHCSVLCVTVICISGQALCYRYHRDSSSLHLLHRASSFCRKILGCVFAAGTLCNTHRHKWRAAAAPMATEEYRDTNASYKHPCSTDPCPTQSDRHSRTSCSVCRNACCSVCCSVCCLALHNPTVTFPLPYPNPQKIHPHTHRNTKSFQMPPTFDNVVKMCNSETLCGTPWFEGAVHQLKKRCCYNVDWRKLGR